MIKNLSAVLLIILISLSACGRVSPAPVRRGTKAERSSLSRLSRREARSSKFFPAPLNGGFIFVRKGDTAYSIAKRHDIPLRTFLEANNIEPPYKLSPGQKLRIPKAEYYTVESGDTLYSIAKKHNISLASLTSMNDIETPYVIHINQRLAIPHENMSPKTSYSTNKVALKKPKSSRVRIPKRSSSRFTRPVSGKTISSFGAKKHGLHNDGINIAAKKGTPVKAAENGVVVYASDKIKGLGNIILIKHSNDWVTAYGHLDEILTKKGTTVKRGSIIGTVGDTGSVHSPQLHFEIRKKTVAVNPAKYM